MRKIVLLLLMKMKLKIMILRMDLLQRKNWKNYRKFLLMIIIDDFKKEHIAIKNMLFNYQLNEDEKMPKIIEITNFI